MRSKVRSVRGAATWASAAVASVASGLKPTDLLDLEAEELIHVGDIFTQAARYRESASIACTKPPDVVPRSAATPG